MTAPVFISTSGAIVLGALWAILGGPPNHRFRFNKSAGELVFHPRPAWKLLNVGFTAEIALLLWLTTAGNIVMSWLPLLLAALVTGCAVLFACEKACVGVIRVGDTRLAKFYWWEFRPSGYSPHLLRPDVSLFCPEPPFRLSNLVLFANLSWLAYRDGTEIRSNLRKLDWQSEVIRTEALLGFVCQVGPEVFVSFRGTNQIKNWISNLDVSSTPGPFGRVHRGFLVALETLWPQTTEVIRRFQNAAGRIWLTGHSLGGALATLAAAKLRVEGIANSPVVYTFGQPTIGDLEFQREFDEQLGATCFRIVNFRDEVPHHPSGFHHVNRVRYLDRHGRLRERLGMFDLVEDSRGLLGEHVMIEYVLALERLIVQAVNASPDEEGAA